MRVALRRRQMERQPPLMRLQGLTSLLEVVTAVVLLVAVALASALRVTLRG